MICEVPFLDDSRKRQIHIPWNYLWSLFLVHIFHNRLLIHATLQKTKKCIYRNLIIVNFILIIEVNLKTKQI